MKWFYISLILWGFALPGWAQKQQGRIERLDALAFQTKSIHLKCRLVDLRSDSEVNDLGMLRKAEVLEWDSKAFYEAQKKWPLYEPVLLYCGSGYRSEEAAEYLLKQGYRTIIVLENGFDRWKEDGFEVVDRNGKVLQADARKKAPNSQESGQ